MTPWRHVTETIPTIAPVGTIRPMSVLDAAYWVTCLVLVVSGVAKLADPRATQATMRALELPLPNAGARVLAVVEVLLGAAGLMAVGPVARAVAALVAATFAAFALVVLAARRRGLDDCGCIGVRPSAPSVGHAVMNLVLGAVGAAAALAGPVDLAGGLGALHSAVAVLVGAGVAAGAGLVVARL